MQKDSSALATGPLYGTVLGGFIGIAIPFLLGHYAHMRSPSDPSAGGFAGVLMVATIPLGVIFGFIGGLAYGLLKTTAPVDHGIDRKKLLLGSDVEKDDDEVDPIVPSGQDEDTSH